MFLLLSAEAEEAGQEEVISRKKVEFRGSESCGSSPRLSGLGWTLVLTKGHLMPFKFSFLSCKVETFVIVLALLAQGLL